MRFTEEVTMTQKTNNDAKNDGIRNCRSATREYLRNKRVQHDKEMSARQRIARSLELGRHTRRLRRDQ